MALFMAFVLSCEDITGGHSTNDGGEPPISCTDPLTPSDKATLSANIAALYAQCGGNSADYSIINISAVTDMSELFKDNTDFNGDISSWDMSGVTNVNSMFEGATAFDQDLSDWVLKVGVIAKGSNAPTKMFYKSGMRPKMLPNDPHIKSNFYQYTPADKAALKTAIAAEITAQGDKADLSIIDTSGVTEMKELFENNATFNGYVATWDTSKVENMSRMFRDTRAFNQRIGDWDTSSVIHMARMFEIANAFNQPIGDWDISQVKGMSFMFSSATVFDQPIGNWKTGNVEDMGLMFSKATAFNQPLKDWDTSKVKNFLAMFEGATAFDQNLKNWSGASVLDSSHRVGMFIGTAMKETNKADWMP